jgi:hypothetical protein
VPEAEDLPDTGDEPDTDHEPDTDANGASENAGRVPLAVVGIIAGLMLGAGVVAVLALVGVFSSDVSSAHGEDELLAAYQRSRNATYTLEGTFSRT